MALKGMGRGMDFLIFAEIEPNKWEPVAGQRDATLNMTADTLDRTCKDSGTWREKVSSFKEWSIDCGGVAVFGKKAYEYLLTAFDKGKPVSIAITEIRHDGEDSYENFMKGKAYITDFSHEFGFEDNMTYSMTLEGGSQLEYFATDNVPKKSEETLSH